MSGLSQFIQKHPTGKLTRVLWERQLIDLMREVEMLCKKVEKLMENNHNPASLQRLRDSLIAFHLFSFNYFMYIQESAPNNMVNQQQALQKIQHEILTLRPLVEQRQLADEMTELLQTADLIAYSLVKDCKLTENSMWTRLQREKLKPFMVFFEDIHLIRQGLTSYDRVPSVAIPLGMWSSPWSWMGIGHEVGHYVYQNLTKVQANGSSRSLKAWLEENLVERLIDNLHQANTNRDKLTGIQAVTLWREWSEEIFADVFGTLMMGPSYVESLISWLLPKFDAATSLLANDHDHPADFLRPLLQIHALKIVLQMAPHNPNTAEFEQELAKLDDSWQELCSALVPESERRDNKAPLDYWHNQTVKSSGVQISDLLADIPVVVETILQAIDLDKSITHVYSPDKHITVKKMAQKLAQTENGALPATPAQFPLSLALPVTWYAHQMIMDNRPRSENLLQKKLATIIAWIKQITDAQLPGNQNAYLANLTPQSDVVEMEQMIPVFDLVQMPANQRAQSISFGQLLALLQEQIKIPTDDKPNKGCRICQELLKIQFSSQDTYSSACITCYGTLSASCFCG